MRWVLSLDTFPNRGKCKQHTVNHFIVITFYYIEFNNEHFKKNLKNKNYID